MVLALVAVAEAMAMRCAAAAALLDAETANDAVLTTLAETVSVLEAETENAPMQMRLECSRAGGCKGNCPKAYAIGIIPLSIRAKTIGCHVMSM